MDSVLSAWVNPRRPWLWLTILFVVYNLAGFFLAPWLIERQMVTILQERVGLDARVERIAVNPYTFSLTMEGLEIDDGPERLLAWDHFHVNFQMWRLFGKAWGFSAFHLDGLMAAVEIDEEGMSNVERIAYRWADTAPPQEPPAEPESDDPVYFIVDDLRIGAELHFADLSLGEPFETVVGPVAVTVEQLSTLPEGNAAQAVKIETEAGAVIEWDGDLSFEPIRSKGTLAMRGPHLGLLSRYLDDRLAIDFEAETVDLGLSYELEIPPDDAFSATVRDVRFAMNGIELIDELTEEVVLSLDRFSADGGEATWPNPDVKLENVEFAGGNVLVEIAEDGEINWMRLLPEGETTDRESVIEVAYAIDRTAISDWSIDLRDQTVADGVELSVADLNVVAEGMSNVEGEVIDLGLGARLTAGGALRFDGELTAFPDLSLKGQTNVSELALETFGPYVQQVITVVLAGGVTTVDGEIDFGPEEPFGFRGSINVAGLELNDLAEDQRLLAWNALAIQEIDLSLGNESLEISRIDLDAPFLKLRINEDGTTNLDELGTGGPEAADAEPVDAEPTSESESGGALAVRLGEITLAQGSAEFTDLGLPLPFTANITELGGAIGPVATQSDANAKIALEGRVDEYGAVTVEGSVLPSNPQRSTDVKMVFQNLEMPGFSPYLIEFAGREIANGKMDLDLGYKLEDQRLAGSNDIVLKDLELGEKVEHPDAMDLPLGLAIGLLKDANGVIDVDIPVSGEINDPEFSYGGVIGKAIVNLLTGIVTSPFRMLAGLVGAEESSFEAVAFTAGREDLSPPEEEKLALLADALTQRPQLQLTIVPAVAADVDEPALKLQKFESLLEARVAETDDGRRTELERTERAIRALYEEAGLVPALAEQREVHRVEVEGKSQIDETALTETLRAALVEAQDVPSSELNALGSARADAVLAALAGEEGVPAERVTIDGATEAEESVDDDGNVVMALSLSAGQ